MKRTAIALGVAAALCGVAGTASAQQPVVITRGGTGHILLVPYFSTNGGNVTLLNIVNTDEVRGKAVKIRFRGASNSDDIFDFQLFLSPGDVWTANVSQGADGRSVLTTGDRSCTIPEVIRTSATGNPFITSRLDQALSATAQAAHTREGYVEIFSMGDIDATTILTSNGVFQGAAAATTTTSANALYTAIKHPTSGTAAGIAPCTLTTLEGLVTGDRQMLPPTSGLMGNYTIINVPETTTWTGDMISLRNVNPTTGAAVVAHQVYWPQKGEALPTSVVLTGTADPLLRTGVVAAADYDLPDLSTPYIDGVAINNTAPLLQTDLLSFALASKKFGAEYLTDTLINASTDWVISMPTRRYHVAVDYVEKELVFNPLALDPAPYFSTDNVVLSVDPQGNGVSGQQACVKMGSIKFYNREEQTLAPGGSVISPGQPAQPPSLCGEVSVLGINSGAVSSPSPTLKAVIARGNANPGSFRDGWGYLTSRPLPAPLQTINLGVPVLAEQFVRATNPGVRPGVSGTFGARWDFRNLSRGDNPALIPDL